MALRINHRISVDVENATKASNNVLKKATQRHALAPLCGNSIRVENQHGMKKPAAPVSSLLRQPLASLKPNEFFVAKKDEQQDHQCVSSNMAPAFSNPLSIEDIDQDDSENPQLCAEYAKDIYKYLHYLETKYCVNSNFLAHQPELSGRMRMILVDWLVQVHFKYSLTQETLYLTVSIIDRYLQAANLVKKSDLQLVGVTAMFIASKYEETDAPNVTEFSYITDSTYTAKAIRYKEREMMNKLGYIFGNPLPLHFLRRNSKAAEVTPEIHTMAKFLMELCLPDYATVSFLPSQQAASALWLSMKLHEMGSWDAKIQHYSGYSEVDLKPCVRRMAELVTKMGTFKQQAVRVKYSKKMFLQVAKDASLKSQFINDIAKGM